MFVRTIPPGQVALELLAIDVMGMSEVAAADIRSLERETGLLTTLKVWIGARVLVTSNVSPGQGVVNGTVGHVTNVREDGVQIRLRDDRIVTIEEEEPEQAPG
jgi:hypothetical protein